MNKLESRMVDAVKGKRNFKSGNTEVIYYPEVVQPTLARMETSKVFLHGNHIATYAHELGEAVVNKTTFALWPTATTRSRLRALGIDAYIKGGLPYINGEVCRGN